MVGRKSNSKQEPELTSKLVCSLLLNKFVVIVGDSIQRGVYKDLVSLLQKDGLLFERDLKAKGEMSFRNDTLIEGGIKGQLNNGIDYKEVRQYQTDTHLIRFYFITRCYNQYVESILQDLIDGPKPDLVIMNSCLWDMTRYGTTAIKDYEENLAILFCRLTKVLPHYCLMVWNTTMPISKNARGGFLVQEIEFKNHLLRMDVLEANYYARKIAVDHGFDVLDLHFWFRQRLDWRAQDGIHWCAQAHRHISKILFSHVSVAWDVPFPAMRLFPSSIELRPSWRPKPTVPMPLHAVADRLTGEPKNRIASLHHVPYSRPAPYHLNQLMGDSLYRQRLDYSSHWNNDAYVQDTVDNLLAYQNITDTLQSTFEAFSLHQTAIPQDFILGWTEYPNDSLRGVQRCSDQRSGYHPFAPYSHW